MVGDNGTGRRKRSLDPYGGKQLAGVTDGEHFGGEQQSSGGHDDEALRWKASNSDKGSTICQETAKL